MRIRVDRPTDRSACRCNILIKPAPPPARTGLAHCTRHSAQSAPGSVVLKMALRLRSRSPLQGPSDTTDVCCICYEPVAVDARWRCLVCETVVHLACMPQPAVRGRFRAPQGCPGCRSTMREVLNSVVQVAPAPRAGACVVCRGHIPFGDPCLRCSAPSTLCGALWHEACKDSVERSCLKCGLSNYQGLIMRR